MNPIMKYVSGFRLNPQEKVIFTDVYQTAIRMLTRRDHSAFEVYEKLSQKQYNEGDINEVIELLVSEKLISDERFTEAYVRMRVEKGFGPFKIRQELRDRGVAREIIDDVISNYNTDWFQNACQARLKRFGDQLPVEWEEQARQSRFLQSRGFTTEQIQAALKTI